MTIAATEQGNTWLSNTDGFEQLQHTAWVNLEPGLYLEVRILPSNYPGLSVRTVQISEPKLAQHIQANYVGWAVRRCNVEGVRLFDDEIAE